MDSVCIILNEFPYGFREENLNFKKVEIEQKYDIELSLQYYEHINNSDNHSYYYYHIPNAYILYLYFVDGKLMHVSVRKHGKVLCSKDF
jgi:hypothetical protein